MNRRFDPSSTANRHPRGTTLIEILAALVVLATLLVSVAIARARFARQESQAQRRLAAVRSADAMLARWLSGPPQNVPVAGRGIVDGAPDLWWETQTIRDPAAARLGAMLVRLQIHDRSAESHSSSEEIAVEFLLHDWRIQLVRPGGQR